MAFSAITARGSAVGTTSAGSIAVSPSANLVVGRVVVVCVATKNIQTTDGASNNHSTVTDTDGHIWQKLGEYTETAGVAADGSCNSIWVTVVDNQISTTDTITCTFSGNIANRIITVFEVTVGANQTVALEQLGVGQGAIAATVTGMTSREYLLVGHGVAEGSDNAKTPDTDYTERFDLRSQNAATAITNHVVTRIATLTADTCTSTAWTNTDPIFLLAALYEVTRPNLSAAGVGAATFVAKTQVFPTFPATPILDDFNRANTGPPPGPGWTDIGTGFKVVSNQATTNDDVDNSAQWTAKFDGANRETYCTVVTKPGNSKTFYLQFVTAAGSGYAVQWVVSAGGVTSLVLTRQDAFVATPLATVNYDAPNGTKIGLRCGNGRQELWIDTGGGWALIATASDTTYRIGSQASPLLYSDSSALVIDDLGGGVFEYAFPQTPIVDTFNRADTGPPLSAAWENGFGDAGLKVVSNQAAGDDATSNQALEVTAGRVKTASSEAYVTVATKPSDDAGEHVDVGIVTSAGVGYILQLFPQAVGDAFVLLRSGSTVLTLIKDIAAGDSIGLRQRGNEITVWHKVAADPTWVQVGGYLDASPLTDTGRGLYLGATDTTSRLDDVSGGNYLSFPYTSVLDNFNRANQGPPMTGWSDLDAGWKVSSNQAVSNDAVGNISRISSTSTGADREAYCTINAMPGTSKSFSLLLVDSSGNGYSADLSQNGSDQHSLFISRRDAYGGTTLIAHTYAAGVLQVGLKIGIRSYSSGVQELWANFGSGWFVVVSTVDTTHGTAVSRQVVMSGDSTATIIDDVGGGNLPSLSSSGVGAASFTGRATTNGVIGAATGVGAASFVGEEGSTPGQGVLGGVAGIAAAAFVGAALFSGVLASSGTGSASYTGAATHEAVVASSGVGAVSAVGASEAHSALASDGVGAFSAVGAEHRSGALSSDGVGAASFVGASTVEGALSASGVGALNAVGALTAESVLGAAGGSGAVTVSGAATFEGVLSAGGAGALNAVGEAQAQGVLSASGDSALNAVSASTHAGQVASNGSGSASFVGASTSESTLSSAGVAAGSFTADTSIEAVLSSSGVGSFNAVGAAENAGVLSATGVAAASLSGESTVRGVLASDGAAAGSLVGASEAAGVLSADGAGSLTGNSQEGATLSAGGTSSVGFVGRSDASGAVSADGAASAALVGASTHESAASSNGVGAASFIGRGEAQGVVAVVGTSTVSAQGATSTSGVVASAGSSSTSLTGAATTQGALAASGVAVANFESTSATEQVLLAQGSAGVAFVGRSEANASFGMSGAASADIRMEHHGTGVMSAAGVSALDGQLASVTEGVFNSNGVGAVEIVAFNTPLKSITLSGRVTTRVRGSFRVPRITGRPGRIASTLRLRG